MRVLWVHNFPPTTEAAGIFMYILLDKLTSMGADITLYYPGSLHGIGRVLAGARRVRRLSRKYDLVHAQYGSACGYVSSFAIGRKLLWLRGTDLLGLDVGGVRHRAHAVLNRWFTRRSLRAYNKIMVVSRRMEEGVRRLHPTADVEVLPSGIDLQEFQSLDRQEARRQLGEGEDQSPWVLFSSVSGAASLIKRVPLALETMRRVQARRPEVKLKLLTGQPHNRVPLWVNASDAVLLTSTQEGWPNIIKESLACNVPFVATNVSDLKAIADAEPSCAVVTAEPDGLAEALLKSLDAGRPASLRRHVEGMDLDAVARRVLRLYEEMCGSCPCKT